MPGARILIVEDEKLIAGELSRVLQGLDYTVAGIAPTGEEALRRLTALRPDLVIMDIELQGELDGIETAGRMRARTDVPIIFSSVHTDLPTIRRAIHSEAYGYVIKPVSREQLYTAIETALQRHRLEKRLAQSEARYRAIVEDQTELICRCLPDSTLTFVNGAFCRFFGKSADQLIGRSFTGDVAPAEGPCLESQLASLHAGNPVCTVEHRVNLPGGSQRWQQWTYRAISQDQERIVEYQLVGRDITERKNAEQSLLFRLDMEDLVATISSRFVEVKPGEIKKELGRALQALGETFGADSCYLNLLAPDGGSIEEAHAWHRETGEHGSAAGLPLAPFKWTLGKFSRFEMICIHRVGDLPAEAAAEKAYYESLGAKSVLAVPLSLRNDFLGFMGFSTVREERKWGQEEIRQLRIMGTIITGIIARTRAEEESAQLRAHRFVDAVRPTQGQGAGNA